MRGRSIAQPPYGARTIASDADTVWHTAPTVTVPVPRPVTRPVDDTVATATFDDCQIARLVTSCVLPSPIVAIAENCAVAPSFGAAPVIASDETVVADVDESPHAIAR